MGFETPLYNEGHGIYRTHFDVQSVNFWSFSTWEKSNFFDRFFINECFLQDFGVKNRIEVIIFHNTSSLHNCWSLTYVAEILSKITFLLHWFPRFDLKCLVWNCKEIVHIINFTCVNLFAYWISINIVFNTNTYIHNNKII